MMNIYEYININTSMMLYLKRYFPSVDFQVRKTGQKSYLTEKIGNCEWLLDYIQFP